MQKERTRHAVFIVLNKHDRVPQAARLASRGATIPRVTSIDLLTSLDDDRQARSTRVDRGAALLAGWTAYYVKRVAAPLRHGPADFLKPRSETRGPWLSPEFFSAAIPSRTHIFPAQRNPRSHASHDPPD